MPNNSKSYVDSAGLSRFLTKLKAAYSSGADGFTVQNATYATYAAGDTTTIAQTYLKSEVAANTYVPMTRVIGTKGEGKVEGTDYVDFEADISAAALRSVLNVADGAQVNVLEGISFKGNGDSDFADLTITNKKAILDLSSYALKSEVARVMDYKGSKTADQLAAIKAGTITADMNGDVYTCSTESSQSGATDFKAGFEYVAVVSGTSTLTLDWVELGKNFTGMAAESWVDQNYVTKTVHNNDISAIYSPGTPAQGDPEDPDYVPAVPESGVLVTKVNAEKDRAMGVESGLQSAIDTLNGNASTSGSVAKSIADAIGALDYGISGASGQQPAGDFVTGVTETNGIIAVTRASYSEVSNAGTEGHDGLTPPTALAVKNYVDSQIGGGLDALDLAQVGANNTASYVKLVSQLNGQVSAEAGAFDTTIGPATASGTEGEPDYVAAASTITAPTSMAVRTLVDSVTVKDQNSAIIDQMIPVSNNDIDALFPTPSQG